MNPRAEGFKVSAETLPLQPHRFQPDATGRQKTSETRRSEKKARHRRRMRVERSITSVLLDFIFIFIFFHRAQILKWFNKKCGAMFIGNTVLYYIIRIIQDLS